MNNEMPQFFMLHLLFGYINIIKMVQQYSALWSIGFLIRNNYFTKIKFNNWSVTSCKAFKVCEDLQAQLDKLIEVRLKDWSFIRIRRKNGH